MRRFLIPIIGLALSLAAPAGAAATGTIEGKVLNATTDEPQAGVEVTLTSGGSSGETESQVVTTGADGKYRFEDLATGDGLFYALDAEYEGGLFAGRAITIPSDTQEKPVIDTTLRVWETNDDPSSVLIASDVMFLVPNEDGNLGVIEAVTVLNRSSDEAYIGRGLADDETRTSIGFALPNGARQAQVSILESSLSVPALLRKEYGFGITTAIPPGETTFTFSYEVDGDAGSYDLSRDTLYPTVRLQLYAQPPLDLEGVLLEKKDDVTIEGDTYTEYRAAEGLDAGDPQQILAVAQAKTSPALLAGMAGVLVLVAALGFIPVWRARRAREREEVATPPDPRDVLLRRIAELDALHQTGELGDAEWSARRAAAKKELVDEIERSRS
jgi:hypothetical protein